MMFHFLPHDEGTFIEKSLETLLTQWVTQREERSLFSSENQPLKVFILLSRHERVPSFMFVNRPLLMISFFQSVALIPQTDPNRHGCFFMPTPLSKEIVKQAIDWLVDFKKQRIYFHSGIFLNKSLSCLESPEGDIFLTEKETALLEFLYHHQGNPQSKQSLLKAVWRINPAIETYTVETHMYRLRQKLAESLFAHHIKIETYPDGYVLHLAQKEV
jgi:DNA-binding winged helix-turn-helix (wHTH) protein